MFQQLTHARIHIFLLTLMPLLFTTTTAQCTYAHQQFIMIISDNLLQLACGTCIRPLPICLEHLISNDANASNSLNGPSAQYCQCSGRGRGWTGFNDRVDRKLQMTDFGNNGFPRIPAIMDDRFCIGDRRSVVTHWLQREEQVSHAALGQ